MEPDQDVKMLFKIIKQKFSFSEELSHCLKWTNIVKFKTS